MIFNTLSHLKQRVITSFLNKSYIGILTSAAVFLGRDRFAEP